MSFKKCCDIKIFFNATQISITINSIIKLLPLNRISTEFFMVTFGRFTPGFLGLLTLSEVEGDIELSLSFRLFSSKNY